MRLVGHVIEGLVTLELHTDLTFIDLICPQSNSLYS